MARISEYPTLAEMTSNKYVLAEGSGTNFKTDYGDIKDSIQVEAVPLYQGIINAGKKMIIANDGTVKPANSVVLIDKVITENGVYDPADDNVGGYSSVVVDVGNTGITYEPNPNTGQEIQIGFLERLVTENGIYYANNDGADAYSLVTVDV